MWSHSSLSCKFKLQVYIACIIQKLLYGLEGTWIHSAGRRKLDTFHVKYLRKILGVAPAFISRITDAFVLKELSAHPLNSILLERQLLYFGHVARSHENAILRRSLFAEQFILHEPKLKRGRPRDTWGRKIMQHVNIILRETADWQACINDFTRWRVRVRSYCR